MSDNYANTGSPWYRAGVQDANAMLDKRPEDVELYRLMAEHTVQKAHAAENTQLYLMAKGALDTLHEYNQERST